MSSYVSFEFSLYNIQSINTKLLFFVDGVLKASYNENLENQVSEKFELSKGLRVLKWVYKHYPDTNDSQDKCNINAILITGSDEGGAPECIKCPIGFTSTIKSLECNPCPPGSSSDDGNLACIPCPNGFYSEKAGQACVECPKNTMVNQNKTACIVSDYLSLKNGTYYITSLTGIVGMNEGNPSLYCKDESMRLYCHETFYGPVLGSDNYFYLSVFNPSNFSLATYSNYDDMRKGYAFGVVSKTKIPYIESDPTQPKEECVKDYSMAVVNLGTRVDSIQETPKGFVVKYGTGSYCNVQKNKRFMTQVNFICDKVESDGWPVFQGQIDCIFAFRWKTMHACKICTSAMMIEKRSYCDNGKRTVQLFESPDCIVANGTSYKSWQEDCNINEDLIQTWPVIIGLCTLGGLLIISGIMIICFCKYKRKYNRLVEYREDGRVSEDARQIEMSDQA